MGRLEDLCRFYEILIDLEHKLGGTRTLEITTRNVGWPRRGVYFFFEPGEVRTSTGNGLRVVRVGTHALKADSQSTLWKRLRQHQGTINNGGGNHRGSVFRLHVGTALLSRDVWPETITNTWGQGSSAPADVRHAELPLEQAVSRYIRNMSFLWLNVDDQPGPDSKRGHVERNAIALLSNYKTWANPLDPPSPNWLGNYADRDYVRKSGLWNVNHVTEEYDPLFLNCLEHCVKRTRNI